MSEAIVLKEGLLHASQFGRYFRNNVGVAYYPKTKQARKILNGMVSTRDVDRVQYGLLQGSGDLIGWTPVQEHGRVTAVFTSLEAKTPVGRATKQQQHWIQTVRGAGGIAGTFTRNEEIEEVLDEWMSNRGISLL